MTTCWCYVSTNNCGRDDKNLKLLIILWRIFRYQVTLFVIDNIPQAAALSSCYFVAINKQEWLNNVPIIFIHNNTLQLNKNLVIKISNIANLLRASFQVWLKNGIKKNK